MDAWASCFMAYCCLLACLLACLLLEQAAASKDKNKGKGKGNSLNFDDWLTVPDEVAIVQEGNTNRILVQSDRAASTSSATTARHLRSGGCCPY